MRETLLGSILTGVASAMFFVNQSLQGTLFVELTLNTVKSKDTSRLLAQMRLILGLTAVACGVVWIVGHIGMHFAPLDVSIQFNRSFTITYVFVTLPFDCLVRLRNSS
jgi:predicted small integral membrane protein